MGTPFNKVLQREIYSLQQQETTDERCWYVWHV